MTWLTPHVGLIAAAIAVPTLLILYFLKLRRRDVEISSTLLWKKAIQDMQANAPFQRLRRNILLFLQMLALIAALIAIAQPYIAGDSAVGMRHVIMIDRSASMSAEDEKDDAGVTLSRLDKAKRDATRLVESLREPNLLDRTRGRSGDSAMVIAFDSSAKALQAFTSDKAALKRAIESVTPTDAPTSIEEAFRLARAQVPRRVVPDTRPGAQGSVYEKPAGPVGTIHLFTDGRLPDLAKADLSRDDIVEYHALGSGTTANIAITSLRAGRAFDDHNRLSIFVGVQTTERAPRTLDVELQIDGKPIAIKSVDLPAATSDNPDATTNPPTGGTTNTKSPNESKLVPGLGGTVFALDRPQGGVVSVHVRTPASDVLKEDDSAWVVAPPSKSLTIAIVTRGNMFLKPALENLPLAKLDQITPEQFEAHVAQEQANKAAPYDVVVLDGYIPKPKPSDPKDAGTLPPGRWLVVNAVPPGLADRGEGQPGVFIDWSHNHPVLRGITLDPIVLGKTRHIEIPKGSPARALATTDSGPQILELTSGSSRAIVLPFDIVETSWPLDVSFVIFLAQSVEFLGDDSNGIGATVQPGGVLSDRVPPGATDLRVELPNGTSDAMGAPSPDGRVVYGPIQRAGIYELSWKGAAGPSDRKSGDRVIRPFAANLLDSTESDIAAAPSLVLPTQIAQAQESGKMKASIPLWPFLLMGMLALLLLEWFVYNRRVQL
jgi:hypothetical protein